MEEAGGDAAGHRLAGEAEERRATRRRLVPKQVLCDTLACDEGDLWGLLGLRYAEASGDGAVESAAAARLEALEWRHFEDDADDDVRSMVAEARQHVEEARRILTHPVLSDLYAQAGGSGAEEDGDDDEDDEDEDGGGPSGDNAKSAGWHRLPWFSLQWAFRHRSSQYRTLWQ